VIDNLVARINAWWVMVLVIGLAFLFGKAGVIVLFLLISFHALREFLTLAYTRRGDHLAIAACFSSSVMSRRLLISATSTTATLASGACIALCCFTRRTTIILAIRLDVIISFGRAAIAIIAVTVRAATAPILT
jgi:hypothetical protein